MELYELMNTGGAIMWIIFGLSVVALAIAVERVIFFAGASADAASAERAFAASAAGGAPDAASAGHGGGSVGRVLTEAAENWDLPPDELRPVLDGSVRHELYRWERGLPALDVIARVAPLLGLLGTVLGMIDMFRSLSVGGAVSAATVTGGIWKALYTTVAGLSAAIPVMIVHSLLSARIDREQEKLERCADFAAREHARSGARMGIRA